MSDEPLLARQKTENAKRLEELQEIKPDQRRTVAEKGAKVFQNSDDTLNEKHLLKGGDIVTMTGNRMHGKAEIKHPREGPKGRGWIDESDLEAVIMTKAMKAAMFIHLALTGRFGFDRLPHEMGCYETYQSFIMWEKLSQVAVMMLLMLSFFEMPLWCKTDPNNFWKWQNSQEACVPRGHPPQLLSGMPVLPCGVGIMLEVAMYSVPFMRILRMQQLNNMFMEGKAKKFDSRKRADKFDSNIGQIIILFMAAVDVIVYILRGGDAHFRIAPYARVALAGRTLPSVRKVAGFFMKILADLQQIFVFLLGSCIIFGWVAAMVFDDISDLVQFGDDDSGPVNKDVDTFSHAFYTGFVTSTTGNLPDVLINTMTYRRFYAVLWVPFIILTAAIFTQVILAIVYNSYQDRMKDDLMTVVKGRKRASESVFKILAGKGLQRGTLECGQVIRTDFEDFVMELVPLVGLDVQASQVLFEALDDNQSGSLEWSEFEELIDCMSYNYKITATHSSMFLSLSDRAKAMTKNFMFNQSEDIQEINTGYPDRFEGSPFDKLMNWILAANVVFMVVESIADFTDRPIFDPAVSQYIDLFFSFIYLGEVGGKLFVWSWGEYWINYDNRFDFYSTVILSSAGFAYLLGYISKDGLKYVNLLRVVRLLKALSNVEEFRTTCEAITNMLMTCADVLLMNFLVIYLWSALGMQLYGGQLYKSNPLLADIDGLDYFDSHFDVFNFNDMFLGMITLFLVMLTNWIDQVAVVTLALHPTYSLLWFISVLFHLGFYVASPLLAFNVFTAFSIDVYCFLAAANDGDGDSKDDSADDTKEDDKDGDDDGDEPEKSLAQQLEDNLKEKRKVLWNDNRCLHLSISKEGERMRVAKGLLLDD